MRVNRREFIVVGLVGSALGCNGKGTEQRDAGAIALTVDISGLCGVVHRDALRVSDVLLVDAVRTQALAAIPHAPRLVIDKTVRIESAPEHDGVGKDDRPFWNLEGFRVALVSGATTGTQRRAGLRRPGEEKLPNVDQVSFPDVSWLADMSRLANTGEGKIHAENLQDTAKPNKVASRVRFSGGTFAARFRKPYHTIPWRIGTGTPSFEQAIGELTYSQSISDERVTFKLEPFGGGSAREIVLAPAAGGDRSIAVEFQNMPAAHQECKDKDAQILAHFRAFYELLESPPSQENRPVPECVENCRDCMAHEEEPVYCPGTGYNPPPGG
jgi:hypothetical protein